MAPTNKDKLSVKDLPLVPESVLKRRHDLDDLQRKRAARLEVLTKKQRYNLSWNLYLNV